MPIYHKTPPSIVGNHNTAEIDYHTSEAAKVKRTREQAYFNSYDFDAIEVLPYDDDGGEEEGEDDEEGEGQGIKRSPMAIKATNSHTKQMKITQQQQHHLSQRQQHKIPQHSLQQPQHSLQPQQQHQHLKHLPSPARQITSNHESFSGGSSSSDSFMVDSLPHQQHVNGKYNPSLYLQRISGIFANKTNNSSTSNKKLQNHQQHHPPPHLLHPQHHSHATSVNPNTGSVVVVVGGIADADNKHLKLSSSSGTSSTSSASASSSSSTSLSSCSAVEEVLSGCPSSGNAGHRDVVAVDLNCVVDVVGSTNNSSIICTTTDKIVNTKSANVSSAGGGGNFLLPRAMLKYQSTPIQVAIGATATAPTTATPSITTANKNSMPLATAVTATTTANNNIATKTSQQQPPAPTTRDVNTTEGVAGKVKTLLENSKTTKLKNSSSSSITTSLSSEDLTIRHLENEEKNVQEIPSKDPHKVLPKTIKASPSARASSHQSHYSTDKSASSGYYSSNVCSTYSLEEHIYSEPTIDIKDVRNHTKESKGKPLLTTLAATSASSSSNIPQTHSTLKTALIPSNSEETSVMRSLDYARRYRFAENDTTGNQSNHIQTLPSKRKSEEFNENLKILESSIENLDRHLKTFPGTITQDAIVAFVQNPYSSYATVNHNDKLRSSSYSHLPTIQEGLEKSKQSQVWIEEKSDDSLMDIDLDSFLLDKDKKLTNQTTSHNLTSKSGLENPSFLSEEQEENHYKCAKYINSCPEDAYRVESDILAPTRSSISEQSLAVSGELYPKRYEEQIHFQNTRELLEDVRDKIRLLTKTQEALDLPSNPHLNSDPSTKDLIPKELNSMISTLKQELELYLERMNQHSELEIRQLCSGLVKNHNIVKMKNAFERRKSLTDSNDICSTYEAVQDGVIMNAKGVPITIRQQITSIRCTSDPNFKMKRKSITEVFPMAECYIETIKSDPNVQTKNSLLALSNLQHSSQLYRNLNYHKPVLEQLSQQICHKSDNLSLKLQTNSSSSATSGGDTSETNDKESILDWHRKKPSIWEMYYGTNRIQQSLLGGKKNGTMVTTATASSPSTMCYPSSRPESDFTLDLPRAEQLRIKMEKEKKFRQRCRVITTFLSLVFFLLTVMVVSLVLTRGKRMFGSMI